MQQDTDRFVVVTGGPGAGKTTLIDALEREGYARTIEAGRAIIREQSEQGGSALPWVDPVAFAARMFEWELRSYRTARAHPGITIFDRGLPDLIGYYALIRREMPDDVRRAAEIHRYNGRVFIAPPWRTIFAQDTERKQDFSEAVGTYLAMVGAYAACGYELVELPCVTVAERVRFVRDRIGPTRTSS
ncbi:MAG: AAA family ATPase [Variibacter sp.]